MAEATMQDGGTQEPDGPERPQFKPTAEEREATKELVQSAPVDDRHFLELDRLDSEAIISELDHSVMTDRWFYKFVMDGRQVIGAGYPLAKWITTHIPGYLVDIVGTLATEKGVGVTTSCKRVTYLPDGTQIVLSQMPGFAFEKFMVPSRTCENGCTIDRDGKKYALTFDRAVDVCPKCNKSNLQENQKAHGKALSKSVRNSVLASTPEEVIGALQALWKTFGDEKKFEAKKVELLDRLGVRSMLRPTSTAPALPAQEMVSCLNCFQKSPKGTVKCPTCDQPIGTKTVDAKAEVVPAQQPAPKDAPGFAPASQPAPASTPPGVPKRVTPGKAAAPAASATPSKQETPTDKSGFQWDQIKDWEEVTRGGKSHIKITMVSGPPFYAFDTDTRDKIGQYLGAIDEAAEKRVELPKEAVRPEVAYVLVDGARQLMLREKVPPEAL